MGNQKTVSISIAAQPTLNEVSFVVSIPEQENVNEQLLKAIEDGLQPGAKIDEVVWSILWRYKFQTFGICYNVVNLPEKGKLVFFVNNFAFLLVAVGNLAVIMLFGSKVNEKIHGFQRALQTLSVSPADEGKLVMFMLKLQGDPKGPSIGGLVVITKSMSLTVVGVIASYFAVMLSLPS
ncbi:hypothetical protein OS493_019245 [Desmophyllum pertusum]|uniref:Uncharacterized protein n=1 Tax=Desmophyllum pertusum TaxID=174260 RepID=A0A9W9YBT4_9CNID|nr:hypothetical protein OS493_019245 [Desmophyllum pertusum]